jgi:hypothetical protein
MKRIIDGKKYDTETAYMVGQWENMYDVSNFHYYSESLYRKRTGEYFLFGEGGARSQYAETIGQNEWRGGEKIIPLTYDNARKWAEEHLSVEVYESEFGEVSEDDESTIAVTVRVPQSTKGAIDKMAARTGRTRGEIVADAIAIAADMVAR